MLLGENIKKIRESKGLGLNETARRVGISGSYLSNLEKGVRENPSLDTINKIAEVLGVTVESLHNSENKNPDKSAEDFIINLLRRRGILKDDEDITEENMEHLLNILYSVAQTLKKK